MKMMRAASLSLEPLTLTRQYSFMITEATNCRRVKVLYISHRRTLTLFTQHQKGVSYVNVPQPLGLPEGYKVRSVFPDYTRDAFGFIIEHPSFDEVPDGVCAPEIEVTFESVQLPLQPSPTWCNEHSQPREVCDCGPNQII